MFLHYKKRFQTCLEMLGKVREQFPVLHDEILSYAGVLDPMAEGWVPVLVGKEENRDRVRHTEMMKEYVVGILVGVSTDSGDLMGVVEQNPKFDTLKGTGIRNPKQIQNDKIQKIINGILEFPLKYQQRISRFANKKYKSKPLWWYALNGVEVPEEALELREVRILKREVLGVEELSEEMLAEEVVAMGEVFGGRFRMERILESWDYFFSELSSSCQAQNREQNTFTVIQVRVLVSKGFFVREWVRDVGKACGMEMCVYSLNRSKILDKSYSDTI